MPSWQDKTGRYWQPVAFRSTEGPADVYLLGAAERADLRLIPVKPFAATWVHDEMSDDRIAAEENAFYLGCGFSPDQAEEQASFKRVARLKGFGEKLTRGGVPPVDL